MPSTRFALRLLIPAVITLVAILVAPVGDARATDCNGKVTYELRTKEDRGATMDYIFGVMAETDTGCGKVFFELHATEQLQDGTERVSRTSYTKKVKSNELKARKIRYKVNKDIKLISWEWVVIDCKACGSVD